MLISYPTNNIHSNSVAVQHPTTHSLNQKRFVGKVGTKEYKVDLRTQDVSILTIEEEVVYDDSSSIGEDTFLVYDAQLKKIRRHSFILSHRKWVRNFADKHWLILFRKDREQNYPYFLYGYRIKDMKMFPIDKNKWYL